MQLILKNISPSSFFSLSSKTHSSFFPDVYCRYVSYWHKHSKRYLIIRSSFLFGYHWNELGECTNHHMKVTHVAQLPSGTLNAMRNTPSLHLSELTHFCLWFECLFRKLFLSFILRFDVKSWFWSQLWIFRFVSRSSFFTASALTVRADWNQKISRRSYERPHSNESCFTITLSHCTSVLTLQQLVLYYVRSSKTCSFFPAQFS